MQHAPATPRNAHVDHGEISAFGGIASAHVTVWADVVPPIIDTAQQKGRKKRDRATAPHLRCIAWTVGDLPEVRAALET